MNINDHRDDLAEWFRDFHSNGDDYDFEVWQQDADNLLASPALARLLAAARDEARAEGETPADVLDGTGVTANTWQSAARRLADQNRDLPAAFNQARAEAWDEGANSRQCHCAAYSDSECACGGYPSERNPYRGGTR